MSKSLLIPSLAILLALLTFDAEAQRNATLFADTATADAPASTEAQRKPKPKADPRLKGAAQTDDQRAEEAADRILAGPSADSATVAPKSKKLFDISMFREPAGKDKTKRVLWRYGRWAGVGVHYNGMVSSLANFQLPDDGKYMTQSAKSIGVTLNPIDFILVGNRKFHLMTGLGFELNNYRFDQQIGLQYDNGKLSPDYQYAEQGYRLSKSKLFTAYVNIPLLLEFRAGTNNNFFVSAGMIGGLRIGAHTKIQGDGPLVGGTAKEHGDFGLRNGHYGFQLNFGYSHIGFNITYYNSPMWRKEAGPQTHQFNFGISVLM